jgi:AcrR family transcriptional regulator
MRELATTKDKLMTAARRLADADGFGFDGAAVAAAAGLAPAAVTRAYADFELLLCELLGQMYDEVRDLVTKLTLNMPAGRARLQLALDAYLQALFERPGLSALAQRLRFHPQGAQLIRQRVQGFNMMLQLELRASDWPQPDAAARLCTAALIEIATAEAEAGRKLPELRTTLIGYFDAGLP